MDYFNLSLFYFNFNQFSCILYFCSYRACTTAISLLLSNPKGVALELEEVLNARSHFTLSLRLDSSCHQLHWTFTISATVTHQGAFSDIVIPCQIANSKQFVFLCISAVVKKPQESFEILVLDEPNQMMRQVLFICLTVSFLLLIFFKYNIFK